MPRYRELTDEEVKALECLKKMYGRIWKSKLRVMWMYVEYPDSLRDVSHILQTLRNQLGPSWLVDYRGK